MIDRPEPPRTEEQIAASERLNKPNLTPEQRDRLDKDHMVRASSHRESHERYDGPRWPWLCGDGVSMGAPMLGEAPE